MRYVCQPVALLRMESPAIAGIEAGRIGGVSQRQIFLCSNQKAIRSGIVN